MTELEQLKKEMQLILDLAKDARHPLTEDLVRGIAEGGAELRRDSAKVLMGSLHNTLKNMEDTIERSRKGLILDSGLARDAVADLSAVKAAWGRRFAETFGETFGG
jgi:hypothetical protein